MGSFNVTCFASQQTIATGDPCVLIPIRQATSYSPVELRQGDKVFSRSGASHGTTNLNSFWEMVDLPIQAVYEDGGEVQVEFSGRNAAAVMSLFERLSQSFEVLAGENESHEMPFHFRKFMAKEAPEIFKRLTANGRQGRDAPIEPAVFEREAQACWEHMWEVAYRYRIFVPDLHQQAAQLQFAVMHQSAYDALVQRVLNHSDLMNESMDFQSRFDRAMQSGEGFLKEVQVDPDMKEIARNVFFTDGFMESLGDHSFSRARRDLRQQVIAFRFGEITRDQLFQEVSEYLKITYMIASLDDLGIRLSPMVYAGQDYDNSIGRAYAGFVQQMSQVVSQARMDRYGKEVPLSSRPSSPRG